MWLAETAADTETLEVLAENGILFTVLSPYQAEAVRPLGQGGQSAGWSDARGGHVDTRRAYRCNLPSGRNIALFFYDGLLSQKIAFGGLLDNGEVFARQLIDAHEDNGQPILSHVATDGESYGHHHDHGDMALAYCLETLDNATDAQLTIYGEFLDFYPPEFEARIIEGSSWSCAHGVERWRSDCGCNTGTPGFHQKWRGPLRKALDWLRDELAPLFEKGTPFFKDPWGARDSYISVVLDRSPENVDRWLKENAGRTLSPRERTRALCLLEMQRAALLMFTSCGWFFDEISRIEALQILRYASRAMELARELFNRDLEPEFLRLLAGAPSNIPEFGNGARVYEMLVRPGRIDRAELAARYGLASILQDFAPDFVEGCWDFSGSASVAREEPSAFSAGTVRIRSRFTGQEGVYLFAANYRGGTSVLCGVAPEKELRPLPPSEAGELRGLFSGENEQKMVDRFGHALYSLRHIPADAQRNLLDELLKQDIRRIEQSVHAIVRNYDQLLEYLTTLDVRPPAIISSAAEIALTANILHDFEAALPDIRDIRKELQIAALWNVSPDAGQITFALVSWLKHRMMELCRTPDDIALIQHITSLISLFADEFKWRLSLYEAQNLYYALLRTRRHELRAAGPELRSALLRLGQTLQFSEALLKL